MEAGYLALLPCRIYEKPVTYVRRMFEIGTSLIKRWTQNRSFRFHRRDSKDEIILMYLTSF